ncbi:RNA-protein complex protein Nop10 [Halovivax limisalsi]|uniref:RNA-protein complex protein Nop10 n=1 Tax=Halovivax limisalsi TaxID=1453760 RepID=UPI001FFCCDF3|nr:RNA-protein complex protein Nop10 [Halovivax limisalsi]
MKSDIRRCSEWQSEHERPVYTLDSRCPECGATAENSVPASLTPGDPRGEYRRALKRRLRG